MKAFDFKVERWNIEEETGYKPLFTFYEDFSIAEPFGASAIEETFDRTFEERKGDHKALTELVMALNWKGGPNWRKSIPDFGIRRITTPSLISKARNCSTSTGRQTNDPGKENPSNRFGDSAQIPTTLKQS